MNIAVTGITGQVGRDVLGVIERRSGLRAIPLDRATLDLDGLDTIQSSLATLTFDVLINCAAYTAVDDAESEPAVAFRRNAYAVEQLALACREAGATFVQLSTDYVFDGEAGRPYAVDDAPAPLNVYGASKLVGEALARRAHGSGSIVVRASSVFGLAGMEEGKGNFVETILRLSRAQDRLQVVADTTMAPTYSADLARALVELLESGAGPGVYHISNGGEATWYDFAVKILELAGSDVPVDPVPAEHYPGPARRPGYSVLATDRAEARVGPMPSWQDALRRYLEERQEL